MNGCETWSLTLREKRRLKLFVNKVLRITFVPKWQEVTGEWRKIHIEVLNDLYCSPNFVQVIKIEKNEMDEACNTYRERRGVYRVFEGET